MLRYRKRRTQTVTAVKLDLDTAGFTYEKWGGTQRCKPGDWLVDNGGDVYTVDAEVFARTYRAVGGGQYAKVTKVWAERAQHDGSVQTREGVSHYLVGDYVVCNQEDGSDSYCVSAAKFESMYELDET